MGRKVLTWLGRRKFTLMLGYLVTGSMLYWLKFLLTFSGVVWGSSLYTLSLQQHGGTSERRQQLPREHIHRVTVPTAPRTLRAGAPLCAGRTPTLV